MDQKEKSRFRSSSKWKKFRAFMKKENKVDYITKKKLYSGWNLHHLDLNDKHYNDLSDLDHFCCLNKMTHKYIHWLFKYENWKEILKNTKEVLEKMEKINGR